MSRTNRFAKLEFSFKQFTTELVSLSSKALKRHLPVNEIISIKETSQILKIYWYYSIIIWRLLLTLNNNNQKIRCVLYLITKNIGDYLFNDICKLDYFDWNYLTLNSRTILFALFIQRYIQRSQLNISFEFYFLQCQTSNWSFIKLWTKISITENTKKVAFAIITNILAQSK